MKSHLTMSAVDSTRVRYFLVYDNMNFHALFCLSQEYVLKSPSREQCRGTTKVDLWAQPTIHPLEINSYLMRVLYWRTTNPRYKSVAWLHPYTENSERKTLASDKGAHIISEIAHRKSCPSTYLRHPSTSKSTSSFPHQGVSQVPNRREEGWSAYSPLCSIPIPRRRKALKSMRRKSCFIKRVLCLFRHALWLLSCIVDR